ncbi:MAG TPA: hypothetical protein PLQ13_01465 [Candidatus Krumholzibacteria bacterium]|nr:hypothetical protein [Candidatus Krumholzibacteria bacterium]
MAEHRDTDLDLEASLAPLGVHELEERLELAPLLAAPGDLQPSDACSCSCSCDDTPDDPIDQILEQLRTIKPGIDGPQF